MPDLSDDDLKFVLSVDPDEDALNKAINQINQQIDSANVSKIKMGLEKQMTQDAIPASFLESKFGKLGSVFDSIIGKSKLGEMFQGMTGAGGGSAASGGMEGVEGAIIGGAEGGGVGAALGAAAGGPLAIAYEAAKVVAKVGGQLGAVPFKVINAGLGAVSTGLREMQGPLGPIGAGLELLGKGLGTFSDLVKKVPILGDLLGPMLEQFTVLPGLVKDITTSLTGMAEKAAPGVVKQFNFALEDAQATIGQAFIPVVELMTEAVRLFADVMANVLPNTREVREGMRGIREVFSELRDELKDSMRELGPIIRDLFIFNLKYIGVTLSMVAKNAEITARALKFLLQPLIELAKVAGFGVGGGGERTATSAARQASMSSIEQYQQRLQLETFGKGTGGESMDVPTNVMSIAQMVSDIKAWFDKMGRGELIGIIAEGVIGLGTKSVRDNVRDAGDAVAGADAWLERQGKKLFGK